MDQRDLVERAQRGDHDAFAALAGAAVARLDAAARLILRDRELARDAVQDAMVRAWRDLPGLRDPDRFDAWLHRLTVNACLDVGAASPTSIHRGRAHADRRPAVATSTADVADRDSSTTRSAARARVGGRSSCSITSSGCRCRRSPSRSDPARARPSRASIGRSGRCAVTLERVDATRRRVAGGRFA